LTRRQQRLRQNQRLIADLATHGGDSRDLLLLCECGLERCGSRVRLTRRQYDRSRNGDDRFIVVPGHRQQTDAVILVADDFWIVETRDRREL
jgi:hypothetical protein